MSSPNISNSSISPIKANKDKVEVSRRVDSHDSDNRSSKRNESSKVRQQNRKSSNDPNDRVNLNEKLRGNKGIAPKCRKDSQETYQPNVENIRLSTNDWNTRISNGVYSPNKFPSNLDQSDYNHFEMIANNTATSALNQSQKLKL